MLACMLQGASFTALAADEEKLTDPKAAIANDGTADIKYADESMLEYTQYIRYPYLETAKVVHEWSFPYSDRFFDIPSSEFSRKTAQGSLGLALSAFRSNKKVVDWQYKTYLTRAGFYNFYPFGYDKPTTEDSLSGVIAMKEVHGSTVIAAVTCGQGYKNEWAGNMIVGKGERHEGFEKASVKLEGYLDKYIKHYKIDGSKKLWITGMSRAAAIANLTAADAIESGEYDDVYAYLFGVPRVTKKASPLKGIYNICGQYDAVASAPLQSWGYERYGIDLYTPAQESDVAYQALREEAAKIGNEIDGKGLRNNPEINYQLRLMTEFMDEFFNGSDEYAERFQDLMAKAVLNHDQDDLVEILVDAFSQLTPEDRREKASITTFIDYVSFIAGQHMRADQRQVDTGSWDPSESLASNLMLEHRPSTYVRWLFADVDTPFLFATPITSRRVCVIGKVDVMVYQNSIPVTMIDKEGNITSPDSSVPDFMSGENGVFTMRNGEETVVSLPNNTDYQIEIIGEGTREIQYLEVPVSPEVLVPDSVSIFFGRINNGSVTLDIVPGKAISVSDEKTVNYTAVGETDYKYSPSVIMRNELKATDKSFLSLGRALRLLRYIILGLTVLLLGSIILEVVHRRKVKKGHPPYSDSYVIIPHLILVINFAVLTQFVSFYLFTIPTARIQFATVTALLIGIMALRGAIMSRKSAPFLLAAVLLVLVPLTRRYYGRLPIESYSSVNELLFYLIVIILTLLAMLTYPGVRRWTSEYRAYRKKIKKETDKPDEADKPDKPDAETGDKKPEKADKKTAAGKPEKADKKTAAGKPKKTGKKTVAGKVSKAEKSGEK